MYFVWVEDGQYHTYLEIICSWYQQHHTICEHIETILNPSLLSHATPFFGRSIMKDPKGINTEISFHFCEDQSGSIYSGEFLRTRSTLPNFKLKWTGGAHQSKIVQKFGRFTRNGENYIQIHPQRHRKSQKINNKGKHIKIIKIVKTLETDPALMIHINFCPKLKLSDSRTEEQRCVPGLQCRLDPMPPANHFGFCGSGNWTDESK